MESSPQGQEEKEKKNYTICSDKMVLRGSVVAESISWTLRELYCASEGKSTYFREDEMRTRTITA